jgi:hypothetical protein
MALLLLIDQLIDRFDMMPSKTCKAGYRLIK